MQREGMVARHHSLVRRLCVPALSLLVTGSLVMPIRSQEAAISIMASEIPPLVLEEPARRGIVLDMVVEAVRRAGLVPHITFMPWKRVKETGSAAKDTLIVPLTRLPSREADFTWIAPLLSVERVLVSLKHRVDTLDQARALGVRIIVAAGSAPEQALKDANYPLHLIISVPMGMNEPYMLRMGRGDAWFTSGFQAQWRWQGEGHTEPLIVGDVIQVDSIYLGCSLQCDPAYVKALAAAVESMRLDGTLAAIPQLYVRTN